MKIFIVGKPKNRAELEAIWAHHEIIFVDTPEEYAEYTLTGKRPTSIIVDELYEENQSHIATQVRGRYTVVHKLSPNLSTYIRQSEYALS